MHVITRDFGIVEVQPFDAVQQQMPDLVEKAEPELIDRAPQTTQLDDGAPAKAIRGGIDAEFSVRRHTHQIHASIATQTL
jgi:hypothetical protein